MLLSMIMFYSLDYYQNVLTQQLQLNNTTSKYAKKTDWHRSRQIMRLPRQPIIRVFLWLQS